MMSKTKLTLRPQIALSQKEHISRRGQNLRLQTRTSRANSASRTWKQWKDPPRVDDVRLLETICEMGFRHEIHRTGLNALAT